MPFIQYFQFRWPRRSGIATHQPESRLCGYGAFARPQPPFSAFEGTHLSDTWGGRRGAPGPQRSEDRTHRPT